MEEKSFVLANQVEIPAIGFGTGIARGLSKHPRSTAKRLVKETLKNILVPGFKESNRYPFKSDWKKDRTLRKIALMAYEQGCRLFDTARAYEYSEEYLGAALFCGGGVSRDDVFLITKATNSAQREGRILEDFELSLHNLQTDHVDLFLLHWPQTGTYLQSWKVMEEIYASGRARAIGICNAHVHHLEALAQVASVMPMVDELECHPLLQQWEVRTYCKAHNIHLIAHTPTGKMQEALRNSPVLNKIANAHGCGVAQVILRWHYQLGDSSIPNTTNPAHLRENLDIWGFELSADEMEEIRTLDAGRRVWPNPDTADFMML